MAEDLEELSKEELELKVAQLRFKEAARPWWQKPSYLAILVPIVLAIIGFLGAWISGYFDKERRVLKNETKMLQSNIKNLGDERDALTSTNESLSKSNEALHEANQKLQTENQRARRPKPKSKSDGPVERPASDANRFE